MRTHPPLSRLVVTQGDYHVASLVPDDPESWVLACQMMDDELRKATGYL